MSPYRCPFRLLIVCGNVQSLPHYQAVKAGHVLNAAGEDHMGVVGYVF
jgi:hypothetical protein